MTERVPTPGELYQAPSSGRCTTGEQALVTFHCRPTVIELASLDRRIAGAILRLQLPAALSND
jgi:hypothetical protein